MNDSLHDLEQRLQSGDITAEALADEALARAAAPDGEGARVFIERYEDKARAMARASDTLREAGVVRSPLEGIPVSIKDLFDVAGETTRAGSIALDDAPAATQDAEIVRRLVAAGAVLVGRTNMTEFAFSGLGLNPHYGTPLNPYDRATRRIPGGSSSGAAVSVTDGMAAAAIGTDTGGSVRIPAALCGLVGFKPSAARVPLQGALPLSKSLDSIGPIGSSVACCALLDAVLSGTPFELPEALPLAGLRLAVPTTLALDGLDETVSETFRRALSRLSAAGVHITDLAVPEFAALAAINAKGGFAASEAWHWHRALIEKAGSRYDPRILMRIRRGADLTAAEYLDLIEARTQWIAAVEMRLAPFDALVMPTVPVIAPRIADLEEDAAFGATNLLMLRNPTLINFLDGCALSLPCHDSGEAPVGLMLAGPRGSDRRIVALGLAVETALGFAG